jgi:hypothetical protein
MGRWADPPISSPTVPRTGNGKPRPFVLFLLTHGIPAPLNGMGVLWIGLRAASLP